MLVVFIFTVNLSGCASNESYDNSNNDHKLVESPSYLYNEALRLYENGMFSDAIKKYKLAAKLGSSGAKWNLGVMYHKGDGVPIDYKEASKWFLVLAKEGDKKSQYIIATMYERGRGLPQDMASAANWYVQSASQGFVAAQESAAIAYYKGKGIDKNYTEAIKLFRLAAESGREIAQYYLGEIYFNGHGVNKNYQIAAKWFEKAASQGHSTATYNLGVLYANGQGVPKDYRYTNALYLLSGEKGSISRYKNELNETELAISNSLYQECKVKRSDCLLLKASQIDSDYLKKEFRKYYSTPPFLQFEKAALKHSLNKHELKQFNCKKRFFGGYKCKRDKKHYDGAEQRMEMTLDSDASLDFLTADIFLPDELNKKFNSLPGITAYQVYSLMTSEWNKKSSNGEYRANKKGIKYKLDL